jgi:hypothetical protein
VLAVPSRGSAAPVPVKRISGSAVPAISSSETGVPEGHGLIETASMTATVAISDGSSQAIS